MSKRITSWYALSQDRLRNPQRRGVIWVLSTFLLIVSFGFAAFAIDLGFIVLTGQQLQNAADAAALAAVLELKTADPTLTRDQIRDRAIARAIEAAGLNVAATRSVVLYPEDIAFGNRHFDDDTNRWVSAYEGSEGIGDLPLNAVQVTVAFDQGSGPRRRLDLFFARALGINTAAVDGTSKSHLTPRDLAFVLDISGSMSYDTGGGSYGDGSAYPPLLFPSIGGTGNTGQRQYSSSYKTNYQYLFTQSQTDGVWGDATQRLEFANQEFPGMPVVSGVTQYWRHWKWIAFCDWAMCESPANDRAVHEGNGQTRNLNVTFCESNNRYFSLRRYCKFLVNNGLVPPIRGQQFIPRDANSDDVLDTFPTAATNNPAYPYPSFGGYYPKPAPLAGFSAANLADGVYSTTSGEDVFARPMCWVRRASLHGITAMIGDENVGNDAFDQVGMLSFGTLSHRDLELTNDLERALEVACTRLTWGARWSSALRPNGNANTNIGMGIRQAIQMLKYSDRARSYTQKTIALLTDGVPNISPSSGNTANEYTAPTTVTVNMTDANGRAYARYWAQEAANEEIVLHTICVGDGADTTLGAELAELTGGVSFVVTNLDANAEDLNEIFIAIGKDKLGKLYLDN